MELVYRSEPVNVWETYHLYLCSGCSVYSTRYMEDRMGRLDIFPDGKIRVDGKLVFDAKLRGTA
jgi:hypothetical protein